MAVVRRAKSDDCNRDTSASVTSDYGSGCDVTSCDVIKSRRVNLLDAAANSDVACTRTSTPLPFDCLYAPRCSRQIQYGCDFYRCGSVSVTLRVCLSVKSRCSIETDGRIELVLGT